jgi:prepilin-type N-terminal cleavage/methylation domain-containing protein
MNQIWQQANHRGFTLIELLLAVGIVALTILVMIGANLVIQQNSSTTFQRSVAVQDAHQVIEQIRNIASNAGGLFPNNVVNNFPNHANVAGFANLPNEAVRVDYTNAGSNPLEVVVTVTWQDSRGGNATVALKSLVTQRL